MTISPSHTHKLQEIAKIIVEEIEKGNIRNKKDLLKIKKKLASLYSLPKIPSNAEILNFVDKEKKEKIKSFLLRKPIRTISGVAIIAVMTSPHPCPHGRCIPCPGGPPYSPQSYTGKEPAALRATRNKYDPYLQVKDRLAQLEAIGHPTDKIDLIIMGGTFPARDIFYQKWFVKRCYDAMNGKNARNLEEAKKINEKAKHRCIGLTIETRPDWCQMQQIDLMLELGATRVELGAQILDDKVLYEMNRGHTVFDTIMATRLAKDAGLKVCYHIMPGLPGSSYENDLESFKKMFRDERFRPDMLKIYPTLVVKPSILYEKWKKGEYEPLKEEDAIDLIAEMKKYVPEWVRIQRVERDIPSYMIEEGIKKSNLRELVHKKMKELGYQCRCIRCREVGHKYYKEGKIPKDIELRKIEYLASNGREIFISLEDREEDLIIAYCRLRIPFKHNEEKVAIVRELKVHGPMVEIGKRYYDRWQHKGFGKILMEEAEKIALRFGKEKLLVLSGVGAKEYYRKLGYSEYGFYMAKKIS
ncbi:MAG: tRNA uridine(34) 5-carboxymethylaminomethyl modification radical SAM/GNAT enzyme Elp3 [Thermoplasmata archaeon]|nr:MAG: tRNA uridine(34) 5-carboxymethylaminomethyl modification radical SAM/GNAT enzyme Elp3 [Thermoplasmata archaeon]